MVHKSALTFLLKMFENVPLNIFLKLLNNFIFKIILSSTCLSGYLEEYTLIQNLSTVSNLILRTFV